MPGACPFTLQQQVLCPAPRHHGILQGGWLCTCALRYVWPCWYLQHHAMESWDGCMWESHAVPPTDPTQLIIALLATAAVPIPIMLNLKCFAC